MLLKIHIGCNDVFSPQCVSKCDFSEKQVDWLSSCTVCIFEAFSQSGFFCGHSESSWVHEKVHESKICSEQVSQLWTFQRGQQPLCVPSSSRMVFVIKKPVAVHSRFRSITFFFLSRNWFGYVVPALNWAGGCSCSILQFNYQAYVLLLDIHLNTEPCPCTQWFILQAYEKEDEAPAAAPAEKKEKAAEKVVCTVSQIRILTTGPCFRSDMPGRTSPRWRAFHDVN